VSLGIRYLSQIVQAQFSAGVSKNERRSDSIDEAHRSLSLSGSGIGEFSQAGIGEGDVDLYQKSEQLP
jgi:hypothetical protein